MIVEDGDPPRIKGSGATVIDVYMAYTKDSYQPSEIAHAFSVDIADVHQAIAYFYRHSDKLREEYDMDDRWRVEEAID